MLTIKQNDSLLRTFFIYTWAALAFLLLCRMLAMYGIPLLDPSESRYGEIARKMLETGDWVTLQTDYGIPFWAKPPLSTWLSAISMHFFGVNEFAARLPGLLLSIGILWLIWDLAKKQSGLIVARVATLVLAGTAYFFLDAGTVMTDPSLIFCVTLSMVAFWHAMHGSPSWSYVFFIGLALGLLAKGPIAIVLIGLPIFAWTLIRCEWQRLWRALPWFKGSLLFSILAFPWYIYAEIRTPGFLNYFIIGEHFSRFLIPGWTGDKYGLAHHERWGMIWFYAFLGMSPWSILGSLWLIKHRKKGLSVFQDTDGWMLYLLLASALPLVFFTFASNIIYTYVFPSLPAFALLFAEAWNRSNPSYKSLNWILSWSLVCGFVFLAATAVFKLKPEFVAKTQKQIVLEWIKQAPPPGTPLVYWDYKTEYSAQFYSAGKARNVSSLDELNQLFSDSLKNYLVIDARNLKMIPNDLLSQCQSITTVHLNKDKTILFQCPDLKNYTYQSSPKIHVSI